MKFISASLAAIAALAPLALASIEDFPATSGELKTVLINDTWGVQFVSYEVHEGLAIVDGDIIYGTQTEFESKIIKDYKILNLTDAPANPEGPTRRSNSMRIAQRSNSIFPDESGIWPKGVVRFKFANQAAKTMHGPNVQTAINRWKAKAPCLQFSEEKIADWLAWDIVTISITSGKCSTSQAGRGGDMKMILDPACGPNEITHEFGM